MQSNGPNFKCLFPFEVVHILIPQAIHLFIKISSEYAN